MATTAKKPNVADYEKPAYESQYADQLNSALSNVTNRQEFTYDPLQDANYQALAKVYKKQGEQAAKNTLGDAAALNGGYGSSYAVTASQQARNDYNQMLASQIPALQEAAYNRYLNNYSMDVTALNALRDADESAYGRYRDDVSDSQWKFGVDYQGYRDTVADDQWKQSFDRDKYESDRAYNYQVSRDKVTDKQWAQEFALQKKSAAARSRSGSSGSVNYLSSNGSSGGGSGSFKEMFDAAQNNPVRDAVNAVVAAASKTSIAKKKKKK